MLTKKQHALLLYIRDYQAKEGASPSYDEMKEALCLHSKSGIHRLINGLEERGFIKRLPNRARAIEILKMPEMAGDAAGRDNENVVSAPFGRNTPPRVKEVPEDAANINVPLHGKIAAGTPVEALENVDEFLPLPPDMLGKGDHYALEIEGDSMADLGIMDGDRVIIRKCERADNGDVVVALVDNEEATLKTLHKRGHQVALKPANPDYSTQILPADRVKIQGKLVGLLRRY